MRHGIRVERDGDYLRAVWVDAKSRRRRKNIGKASELRDKDIRRICDELLREHAINPRAREQQKSPTLKAWLDGYAARRKHEVSAGQALNDARTAAYLLERFGDVRLDQIGPADADDWAHWLRDEHALKPITAAGHLVRARTMFRRAVDRGECRSNPFAAVVVPVEPVQHATWVDAPMIQPLLDACPGPAWRALLALCVYTGCRRSEALALEWAAIRWGEARLTMPNIKTRRSTGATTRTVRMEPELERVLLECRESAQGPLVAPVAAKNLDRDVRVIYKRAGIDVLSDPFKVWRRWRSDEWERVGFPRAVVRQWIGNSEAVAQKHYDGVAPQFYGGQSPLEALAAAEARIRELTQQPED